MLKTDVRRWVAVWYRCPSCGAQSAETMLTPWRYRYLRPRECFGWKCNRCTLAIVERRWYTTFCIEPGVSFTTIAGTLESIGPFKLCDIVHRDIRAFRKWYRQRRAEVDEQARQYRDQQRQIDAEAATRRHLLKEAEGVAYRRAHAVELAAEQVARDIWPMESQSDSDFDPFFDLDDL